MAPAMLPADVMACHAMIAQWLVGLGQRLQELAACFAEQVAVAVEDSVAVERGVDAVLGHGLGLHQGHAVAEPL
ncbi:MAG: hypothetical protein NTU53_16425, partial [Planctomycetota bacterium]|nr:hypothetical protein [Planctomycetota bacterium]